MNKALEEYLRNGDTSGVDMNAEGQAVLDADAEAKVNAALYSASPFRRLASVLLTKNAPGAGELYAMPAATQTLLDDGIADIDTWLADEVRDVFAAQETAAFISGDGVNKPRGILVDAEKLLGFETKDIDPNSLIDFIYALKPRDRAKASFIMNRRTLSDLRKIKDADGQYIWTPSDEAGKPSSLLGYPLVEVEEMPDLAPGSTPIAFGNFERGYEVVDRQGVRVLRDPYSAKPYVLFYTTKRVGGGVKNGDAIALLKIQKR